MPTPGTTMVTLEAADSRELQELKLLYETSQRISTAMDIDGVVHAYLEQVAASGRYVCSIALYEYDGAGKRSCIAVRGRWAPARGMECSGDRYSYLPDSLDALLDTGETVTIENVETDRRVPPSLRRIQMKDGRPALAMVPLMVREERIGLVLMSCSTPHEWSRRELWPFQATAAQLAMAIDSRRQIEALHERSRQVAVLEERQRLARDLHDSTTQLLFSITLIAQSIAPAWERSAAEGTQRVERLLELSQTAQREMRRLLAELRPSASSSGAIDVITGDSYTVVAPAPKISELAARSPNHPKTLSPGANLRERLNEEGLALILRQHVAGVRQDGIAVTLQAPHYQTQSSEIEEALLYVAQEAIHNAVKHAMPGRVQVHLGTRKGIIELKVKDNGRGFQPEPAEPPAPGYHLGLASMRERMTAVGGRLTILSSPGKRTTVVASVPERGNDEVIGASLP